MTDASAFAATVLPSPIGRLGLIAGPQGLSQVILAPAVLRPPTGPASPRTRAHLERARCALRAYFAGKRRDFDDLLLAPRGTDFQRAVWGRLQRIPFGATCSYVEIARQLGRPGGARAVGAANARNPLAVVVPCHRVIGGDGSLTGYAGGLARKQWLLRHEGALAPASAGCDVGLEEAGALGEGFRSGGERRRGVIPCARSARG